MSNRARLITVCALILLSSACSWVELKPEGQNVQLVKSYDVRGCKKIGHVTSNTTATVMWIPRDSVTINDELIRLSRNHAASIGGDRIFPVGPPSNGEQTFTVFHCGR